MQNKTKLCTYRAPRPPSLSFSPPFHACGAESCTATWPYSSWLRFQAQKNHEKLVFKLTSKCHRSRATVTKISHSANKIRWHKNLLIRISVFPLTWTMRERAVFIILKSHQCGQKQPKFYSPAQCIFFPAWCKQKKPNWVENHPIWQHCSRGVLVSTWSVLFWKVTGCCLLFRRFTSCLLCAKFSWIVLRHLLLPAESHCQMHIQVCGGVALDGALTGWGGWNLEAVPLSNLASSLASSPGLIDSSFNYCD